MPDTAKVVFREVNAARPCPVCGKADYCCLSDDGVWCVCRRVAEGGRAKTDTNGATYYVHRLVGDEGASDGEVWPDPHFGVSDARGIRGDPDILDRVYRALLAELPLIAQHADGLERRGLRRQPEAASFAAAFPAGYRTLDRKRTAAVQKLVRAGMEDLLPSVPGFFVQERAGRRYWTLSGWGGLIIPVRDHRRRIVALLLRADEADADPRYRYISSKKRGGAGPGAPVHVPLYEGDAATVRVTEGALKADAATALSGLLTIGLPGVSAWRRAAKVLRQLGAGTARLAFDADARTNRAVAEALVRLAEDLGQAGFAVELERWPAEAGKGIDDVLAAGQVPEVLVGAAVQPALEEIQQTAREADPPPAAAPEASPGSPLGPVKKPWEDFHDPHFLARVFLDEHQHPDRRRFAFYREQFWTWDDKRWVGQPDAEIRGQLARFCKRELDKVFALLSALPRDDDKQVRAPKVTTGMVTNVMQALSGEVLLPQDTPQPAWLGPEQQPSYLALDNGLLDVDALLGHEPDVLRPHSPLWFSPVCLPYAFDPDADCPRWRAFLARNLEAEHSDKARVLQQFFGYCLLPDTSLQRFLTLVGEGANGKSVICACLRALLGESNISTVPLEMFADKFRLVGTLGKLANIVAEVGELERVAEAQLKAFVTGDPLEFERKFKAAFTARPTAKLVLATNNVPQFSDKSDGLWRRMLLLRCTVQIPPEERLAGMDTAEWWRDTGELPGILNWALAGLYTLRRAGRFVVPGSCQHEVDRLRVDLNPARRFLADHYQAGCGEVDKADVYARYREWCEKNGHHPLAANKLAVEVFRAFPAAKDGKPTRGGVRVRVFQGVEPRSDGWGES
jgi:P4 family phage/plasmid primase-like protien